MSDFYFVMNPVKRVSNRKVRVYSVTRERKEQGDYSEEERKAEARREERIKETKSEEKTDVTTTEEGFRNCSSQTIYHEMTENQRLSLEERREQLAFRKRAQESGTKRSQIAAAYGKE